jgi:hypothetical protein
MAGLFANLPAKAQQGALVGQYSPQNLSTGDRLALFGAALKDIGNYGQSNNIMDVQQMLAGRQLMAQQMGLRNNLAGLFAQPPAAAGAGVGPGGVPAAPGAPTQPAVPNIAQVAPMLARAQAMGIDIAPYLSLYDKMRPEGVSVAPGAQLRDQHTGAILATGAPEVRESGGYTYTIDPATGSVTWGGERPMNYGEVQSAADFQHKLDQDLFNNRAKLKELGLQAGQLGVAQGGLGVQQGHLALDRINAARQQNPTAPVLMTQDDYARFPGGPYIAPDGSVRIKAKAR